MSTPQRSLPNKMRVKERGCYMKDRKKLFKTYFYTCLVAFDSSSVLFYPKLILQQLFKASFTVALSFFCFVTGACYRK